MGRKCAVESCLSDSGRSEDTGVTFHKLPMHPDIRPKWMSLCKIPGDKRDAKVIYICSRHFLRADFCNFKGKKYMLKQGVLPSVFPWSKTRPEANTGSKEKNDSVPIEAELIDNVKEEVCEQPEEEKPSIEHVKTETPKVFPGQTQSTTIEQKVKMVETPFGGLNFAINARIEALDFNEMWFPARIIEIDYEENEVLIHFEKYSSKYDEWICMDSARLRPLQPAVKERVNVDPDTYDVGERCMALWSDARKFPATVNKIIDKETYEVLFDDGYVKILKAHRMVKLNAKNMQSSPLFDPIRSTKQERRDKKRKLNVAALFGKRSRVEAGEDKGQGSPQRNEQYPAATTAAALYSSPTEELEYWTPSWENGRPVGVEAQIEMTDGTRSSVIVPDPRLPSGWIKHLTRRMHGASAGKWDTVIINPEGRRFRTRSEIRTYLEANPHLRYAESMFDFSVFRRSRRSYPNVETTRRVQPSAPKLQQAVPKVQQPAPVVEPAVEAAPVESSADEEDDQNSLKIPIVNDAFQCPIEGCGKNFRKENLAQMHVKHYHPEYTKFLNFTPNVADLAYARTVGEALDKSPGPSKPVSRPVQRTQPMRVTTTPKVQSPISAEEQKLQSSAFTKAKDSEIIKLLNSKPFDTIKEDNKTAVLPSGLPLNMYPDIKLKDLLNKSEGIPKRDDLNLKSLSASTARPTGIKTLLPVIRPSEIKVERVSYDLDTPMKPQSRRYGVKRRRHASDPSELKPQEETKIQEAPAIPEPQNNVIIEGGEVIKIVRMKREEIINCTCGITEEDGLMIQCELCLCWQHAYCNNIERENQVPEKYVCYICQNPARQRSSRKYFHDQDWLKVGSLPTASYHSRDEELLGKRFEKLKKSHDISGGLLELKDFVHTLKVKIKIAEAKNHPKLYQWSKPWPKLPLPEKICSDTPEQENLKLESTDTTKCKEEEPKAEHSDSMLFSILKSGKEEQKIKDELSEFPKIDINTLMDNTMPVSNIPQPEAAIDTADCRLNLLEHIAHSQSLVEERLNDFEDQIKTLETESMSDDDGENYPRVRQTLQMLLRDLGTLKEFSQITTI